MSYRRSRSLSRGRPRKMLRRTRSAGRLGLSGYSRARVVRGYTRKSSLWNRFTGPGKRPERKYLDINYGQYFAVADPAVGPVAGVQPFYMKVPVEAPRLLTATGVTATGALWRDSDAAPITHLLQLKQGPGSSERIGRKVFVRSMELLGRVCLPAIAASDADTLSHTETHHLFIYQDTQVNGLPSELNQLFQNTPGGSVTLMNPRQFHNIANSSRFRMLKHIVTPITRNTYNAVAPAGIGGATKDIRVFLKLAIPIEYSNFDADGTISSLRDNGIFIATCADTGLDQLAAGPVVSNWLPNAAVSTMYEQYHIRFRYTDN